MKGKLLLVLVLTTFSFCMLNGQQACLNNAWKAFGAEEYETAIKHCDQCIEQFGDEALKMQGELEAAGNTEKSFPSGGADKETKDKIFKNWAVNDVSTAYFIKGISAKRLHEAGFDKSYKEMANSAFQHTCELSFGRCWDTKGWFWSPCEAAKEEQY